MFFGFYKFGVELLMINNMLLFVECFMKLNVVLMRLVEDVNVGNIMFFFF